MPSPLTWKKRCVWEKWSFLHESVRRTCSLQFSLFFQLQRLKIRALSTAVHKQLPKPNLLLSEQQRFSARLAEFYFFLQYCWIWQASDTLQFLYPLRHQPVHIHRPCRNRWEVLLHLWQVLSLLQKLAAFEEWFAKYSIRVTWELRHANSQALPQNYWLTSHRVRSTICVQTHFAADADVCSFLRTLESRLNINS